MNNPTLEAIESLEEQNKKLLKIQHALEKKVSQLKDFAGIITHDVRGPAHNISKMLDMYESTNDPELKKASMDYLKKISNDLTNNLNELIQILQIHLEKDIPASDCIFEDVINSAALQLQDIIQQKNATITMDLAVTNILYPKVYLQSILYNLLSNSLKYTKPSIPPVIHVSTYENEGNCYLSVSDNGLGIDLNKFGHLLFKFQKSFHSGFDSKGIGLYLIKNQIEEQGGTIHCTSEPQIGTKFTVRF
ncbi:ATP-binding protein [Sediminibacterium sp.]|jgi:signal transduction histidine kinase|uniref:sensor histidine kinase n=1 Tax=Sediminibacterium sp. TaxID=1917865 RepID=UPI00271D2383|nr:HAMP domain-containing sensor histidine kinase [Sediminibacterium sp.]MDO9157273.1 HAMP domain-containing sensor histidine kinase [Sediminibacterium sp.]MDP2422655.1 HAMP domain-containing sensor histidine kinase [Sediminibacterium sp.]